MEWILVIWLSGFSVMVTLPADSREACIEEGYTLTDVDMWGCYRVRDWHKIMGQDV